MMYILNIISVIKKDSKRYIKAQELYISKTIMDEWDLLKKTIGLRQDIKQAKKDSQVSDTGKNSDIPISSEIKKIEKFLNEKNAKIMKRSHSYKSYTTTYSVGILNHFNPEQLLKDTEYASRNKLMD